MSATAMELDDAPADDPQDPPGPPRSPAPPGRPRWYSLSLPGLWVALFFVLQSFSPSLLPRTALLQGAVTGVSAAIGYGLGVVGAWVWRAFADRDARVPSRRAWIVWAVVAGVVLVVGMATGAYFQNRVRDLMGEPTFGAGLWVVVVPVLAVLVFALVLAVSRGLRRLYRFLARTLRRWIGPRAAAAVGWIVVAGGVWLLVTGVLADGAINFANQSFSVSNGFDKPGVEPTTSSLRSGGPESVVSWDSLGREGRAFVAGGPTAAEISAFTGEPALEPIRAFAGLDTADESEERARLAVEDLERAGGFDRDYLVVATTTGSGWVSPGGVDSFEYMVGGDSAVVAMQYSFLPSWISYLVDQAKAREAGRDLFDAVYQRWLALPADSRPELVVFGESLGTFGAEAAFSGEADLSNRTSGALLTGPPNFNELYREFVDGRAPGTTEVAPVFRDGRTVRFESQPGQGPATEVPPVGAPWPGTRVLYVQHPSDPIVWWSPSLLYREPAWLTEPRGVDVLPQMEWIPFVTFFQVSADLPGATAVPPGHGHLYTPDYVDGWAEVLQPAGWTTDKRDQLQQIILDSAE